MNTLRIYSKLETGGMGTLSQKELNIIAVDTAECYGRYHTLRIGELVHYMSHDMDRTIRIERYHGEGISYYDAKHKTIKIFLGEAEIEAFQKYLYKANRRLLYKCERTKENAIEKFLYTRILIHELAHCYINQLLDVYGLKRAVILECKFQQLMADNPIDIEYWDSHSQYCDSAMKSLVMALGGIPADGVHDEEYLDRPLVRLQEILANWIELTWYKSYMSGNEKLFIMKVLSKDIRHLLGLLVKKDKKEENNDESDE